MKRFMTAALLTVGLICYSAVAHAGGWTQPKGKGYFKLSQQIVRSDTKITEKGTTKMVPTVNGYTTSLYGEFGLADRVTLVGYMPFYTNFSEESDNYPSTSGIGDWDVGIRIGLLTNGPTVVSLQALAGLPLGSSGSEYAFWTGDGEFNQHFSLQVGHSLYPTPGYLKAEVGYNNRKGSDEPSEDYADELRYGLEAGFTVAERLGISVWLRGIEVLGRADDEFLGRREIEYTSFGPQLSYSFTPNAGIAATMSNFTRGHSILDGPAWEIGVFYKL